MLTKDIFYPLSNVEFRKLVTLFKEPKEKKKFYEAQELRKIDWPAYNLTQINDAKASLMFIRDSVNYATCLDMKGKVGRPLTNPKLLAKAVLVSELLGFTERNAEGWLDLLGPFLGVHEHLDERTIGEAYDKLEVLYILNQIFHMTVASDGVLSGDGSGLETSRRQCYGLDKTTTKEFMTSIVDSREIVQSFDFSGKHEREAMRLLVREVSGDSIRLDAGFNERDLTEAIEELCMTPYIYPTKKNNLNGHPAWKFMYLEFFLDVYAWLKEYHQRSHCESFHSAFKRVFGIVTKERSTCRLAQITARIIIHNFRRLSYFARAKYD
jgi:transposase